MSPAVAVSNDACATHDNTFGPLSPRFRDLVNLLRRIANYDDAPGTIQADARGYLQHLEAAALSSGSLKDGPGATGDPSHAPAVVEKLPRPRRATG